MTETPDLLQGFRAEVPEPDPASQAEVLRRILSPHTNTSQPRMIRPRRRLVVALGVGSVAAAALLAVLLAAPWHGGPAALTPAKAAVVVRQALAVVTKGQSGVFHERSETTFVPVAGSNHFTTVVSESWKEKTSPYRFRLINPLGQNPGIEVGGSLELHHAFAYDAATNTLYRDDALTAAGSAPLDSASATLETTLSHLRGAIKAGAPVTKSRIDGRSVYRIGTGVQTRAGYDGWAYYVDAKTYAPVRIETGGPPLKQPGGRPSAHGYFVGTVYPATKTVTRILAYEQLAATDTSRRLSDIEAAHPTARHASTQEMPSVLRLKLQPLTFALPVPTLNPASAPKTRLLVDVAKERIGPFRLDSPLQSFMSSWPNPEFFTAQQTLDPRYPAVALWRGSEPVPWAAVDFKDQAAMRSRSIYYRGPFTTSRGDTNGTPLKTFFAHWPEHRKAEHSHGFTRVKVQKSSFWFNPDGQLVAVQIGDGAASAFAFAR